MTVKRELVMGDLLKSEADPNSRMAIAAENKSIGDLVNHPERNEPLFALSNSENGQVLVQPHNCVIDLSGIKTSIITAHTFGDDSTPLTLELLKSQGDAHGIKYTGIPQD